jgi:hypothetical protein
VINLITAKALGLTIPESFVLHANEVTNKFGQCLLLMLWTAPPPGT